ncbi:M18 family aminopeptidase [Methyloglobulus sp.]|uniref:M18 family aminopeptidase n=1 Tax=Methyloglobulus sp. TaxID=2518622 RepID=UPI0017FC3E1B|nr:M18 family aminopeptidase [Methyloglobulus sp.]
MSPHHQIQNLLSFIDTSPSPWHVVSTIESLLKPFQFTKIDETTRWELQPGGRYYVVRDDSSIILFVLGTKPLLESGFKIVGAHTDSPGLRVKPNAVNSKDVLLRLNVEIYGGPILATFTDRDLSLAGRICYKNDQNQITSQLIRFDKPLLRLPNLAIHMNRTVNEDGLKLHKQNELPLILSALSEQQLPPDYFLSLLEKQSGIDSTRVLSWDLAVYDIQKGAIWGAENEFYSNSQLDNLASCHAALQALLDETALNGENTLVCAFFDHEEIGSESKQGADGSFLPDVLQRITLASCEQQDFPRIMAKSFLISADMAHAYHPNFPAAYDHDHKVLVNKGPVIKVNTNHRYSSESISQAMFIDLCNQANVPYQYYSHRCDLPCGSTIGPITSAKLGIRSVDVGNPMWAMHSIRESAGVFDHDHMIAVLKIFFQSGTNISKPNHLAG